MTNGKTKSRTLRKVYVKTPGSRNVVHYRTRKPKKATCPVTGEVLHGVARERPLKMKNLPKTAKRPERPFGGVLSSKAMRVEIKKRARKQ